MSYKVQKPCKVCGKLYTPCGYCESDKQAFHWRLVACSYECGMEYFRRVEEARKPKTVEKEKRINTIEKKVVDSHNSTEIKKNSYKKKYSKESEQID